MHWFREVKEYDSSKKVVKVHRQGRGPYIRGLIRKLNLHEPVC